MTTGTVFDNLNIPGRTKSTTGTVFDSLPIVRRPEPVPIIEPAPIEEPLPVHDMISSDPGAFRNFFRDPITATEEAVREDIEQSKAAISEQFEESKNLFLQNVPLAIKTGFPTPDTLMARAKTTLGALGVLLSPGAPVFNTIENLGRTAAYNYVKNSHPGILEALEALGYADLKNKPSMKNIGIISGPDRPSTGIPAYDVVADIGAGTIPLGPPGMIISRLGPTLRLSKAGKKGLETLQELVKVAEASEDIPRSVYRTAAQIIPEAPRPSRIPKAATRFEVPKKTAFDTIEVKRPAPVAEPSPGLRPSVDHGILSPSGKISKRAKDAAIERTRVELFGEKGLEAPKTPQPTEQERLLRQSQELRELADRGMKPRAYRKKADELEARAKQLAPGKAPEKLSVEDHIKEIVSRGQDNNSMQATLVYAIGNKTKSVNEINAFIKSHKKGLTPGWAKDYLSRLNKMVDRGDVVRTWDNRGEVYYTRKNNPITKNKDLSLEQIKSIERDAEEAAAAAREAEAMPGVEPEVKPMVEEAVEMRLHEIEDLFSGELGGLSGKRKEIKGLEDMTFEATQKEKTGFGKIRIKSAFPETARMKEPPGRIAEAIRKDEENPLYLRVKKAVKDEVLERHADDIEDANELARERRAIMEVENEAPETVLDETLPPEAYTTAFNDLEPVRPKSVSEFAREAGEVVGREREARVAETQQRIMQAPETGVSKRAQLGIEKKPTKKRQPGPSMFEEEPKDLFTTIGGFASKKKPPEVPPTPIERPLPVSAKPQQVAKRAPEGTALAEAEKVTQVAPKKPSALERMRTTKRKIQTSLVSEFTPIRKLEKDVLKIAGEPVPEVDMARKFEQVAGARGRGEADIRKFRRVVVDPVRDIAGDFNTFLFLKRTESRLLNNPTVKKVGLWTVEKARTALDQLQTKIGPENMARLERAGELFQIEMDKALRLQVISGRMTEDLYQKIKASNDFYARFKVMKYMEDLEMGIPGTGRNIATTQDLTKAITGISEEDLAIGNILQASAEQIYRSWILAEKNLKMLELDKLIEFDRTGTLIARARPTRYFKDDPDTAAQILNQLNLQQTARNPQLIEQSLVKVGQAIKYAEEVGLRVRQKNLPMSLGRGSIGGIQTKGHISLKAFTSEVISHELGHNFDKKIGSKMKNVFGVERDVAVRYSSAINEPMAINPKTGKRMFGRNEFQKELSDLVDYSGLGGSPRYRNSAKERFAVFMDVYIHSPKKARELAPTWTDYFEAKILTDPQVKALVEKLSKFFHKVDKLPNIMTPLKQLDNDNYLTYAIQKAFPKREKPPRVIFGTKPKPGNRIVTYYKDGNETAMEVSAEVAKAIEGLSPAETEIFAKTMMAFKIPLQWGATSANAAFQVVNLLFADLPRAALVSRYGINGIRDLYKFPGEWVYSLITAMKGNFGHENALYTAFLKSGAANSTIQRSLTPSAFKATLDLPEKITPAGVLKLPKKLVLDNVAKFSNAIEETSKILGLKRGIRMENIAKMEPEEAIKTMQKIVAEVRNYSGSPDFLRHGREAQKLNLLFMFFNARMQGAAADIARLAGRTGKKEAREAWKRLGVGVGLPATFLSVLNHTGPFAPFYKQLPKWEKDNYFILPVGIITGDTFINRDGIAVPEYYRVPKREITKIFGNFIDSAVEFVAEADPEAFLRFAVDFIESISPINIEGETFQERLESMGSSLNPAFKAPGELWTGRDWFRHYPTVPEYMAKAESQEKYRETTGKPYVWLGDTAISKALGLSPLEIEQLVRSTTAGGLSQFTARKPYIGRTALSTNPVARRFYGSGAIEDRETEEMLAEAESQEANEQVRQRRESEALFRQWKEEGLSEKEVNNRIAELSRSDMKLAEKTWSLVNEEREQISYQDKRIRQLGVESGARARFIVSALKKMTKPQRQIYLTELQKKKILTKTVYAQITAIAPEMFY